jgi:membrane protein involved in colicin uptake
MSLEAALQENTAAMIALTAAIAAGGNIVSIETGKAAPAPSPAASKSAAATGTKSGGNTAALEKARAAKKAAEEKAKQEEMDLLGGGGTTDEPVVTLAQLREVGMKLVKAKKGQELKDCLADNFGAESLTALSEDQYADVLPVITALLG